MSKQELDGDRIANSNDSLSASLEFNLSVQGVDGRVTVGEGVEELFDRTWLAITSSHLGKSTELHADVCRYLSRSMIDARERGFVVLAAVDSAIEPWARRAAELYGVPLLLVRVSQTIEPLGKRVLQVTGHQLCRDRVVVCLADRVDCVFVRSGGKIETALQDKLAEQSGPRVRVAVHKDPKHRKVSIALMDAGAVGYYCNRPLVERKAIDQKSQSMVADWMGADGQELGERNPGDQGPDGQWLVHCTRARNGPWPGQTLRQYQDELLLCDATTDPGIHQTGTRRALAKRTSLDSLMRILKTRRLAASALTSDRRQPVVCFSEQPLRVLLARRSYRSHLHRWDYEPYGIAIRKCAAEKAGAQKVIYGDPADRAQLPAEERFRFQSCGKTYDWTEEREWRFSGDVDLEQFDVNDVRVFVQDPGEIPMIKGPYRVESVESLIH